MILNAVVYCAMMFQNEPVHVQGIVLTTPRLVCDRYISSVICKDSVAVNFKNVIKVVPTNNCLYTKPNNTKIIYELPKHD